MAEKQEVTGKYSRVNAMVMDSYREYKKIEETGGDPSYIFGWYPTMVLEKYLPEFSCSYTKETIDGETIEFLDKKSIGKTIVDAVDSGKVSLSDITCWLSEYLADSYMGLITSFSHITRSIQFEQFCNKFDPTMMEKNFKNIIEQPIKITTVIKAPYLERILIRRQIGINQELAKRICDYLLKHKKAIVNCNPSFLKAADNIFDCWLGDGEYSMSRLLLNGKPISECESEEVEAAFAAYKRALKNASKEAGWNLFRYWSYVKALTENNTAVDLAVKPEFSRDEIPELDEEVEDA